MADYRLRIGYESVVNWPFTIPASGTIGAISSNVLEDVSTDAAEDFTLTNVLGAWSTAGIILLKTGSVVTDILYVMFGAGHSTTDNNDGVYMYRASTGAFERILAPTTTAAQPIVDTVHGENNIVGRPCAQHTYSHVHGLNSDEANGPSYMQLAGAGLGQSGALCYQGHKLDISTATWARYGDIGATTLATVDTVVKDTIRQRFVRFPSSNGVTYYTLDYTQTNPTWQTGTQTSRDVGWSGTNSAVVIHDTVRDLYIGGVHLNSAGSNLCAIAAGSLSGSWSELTLTGTSLPNIIGQELMHRTADDTFLLVDYSTSPPTGIFVLTPPTSSPLTNAWTVSRRSFTGTSRFANGAGTNKDMYGRAKYIAALDAIILCPAPNYPMECWKL